MDIEYKQEVVILILTQRETSILRKAMEVLTIELIQEYFEEYDFEVEELVELERKILESNGFTIKLKK